MADTNNNRPGYPGNYASDEDGAAKQRETAPADILMGTVYAGPDMEIRVDAPQTASLGAPWGLAMDPSRLQTQMVYAGPDYWNKTPVNMQTYQQTVNGEKKPNRQPGPDECACTACGYVMPKSSKFCPECGAVSPEYKR